MPQGHLRWGAEGLWQALSPLMPGLSVEVLPSIGSTNSELLARVRGDARGRSGERHDDAGTASGRADGRSVPFGRRGIDVQPCLLVAEHQTQGRGRQGKDWQSQPGLSLTFSLVLPLQPADFSGLSLAVGLALADALEPAATGTVTAPAPRPRLGLKWPNDLLLRDPGEPSLGRKLGGILIETVQAGGLRLVVVGVGLNVLPLPLSASGPALSHGQANLQELLPGIDAPAALARVAPVLVRALLAFEREGFAPLAARFAERDVLRGQTVTTTLADVPQGVADGVDGSGTLWLRLPDGERRAVASGEVSIRRAPAHG